MAVASIADLEARVQAIGRQLLEAAEDYRPGPAERIEDWLLTRAVADERFRGRLLRYMDVLASLDYDRGGGEAKRLAGEYFDEDFPELPRGLRWLIRIARDDLVPAPLLGETARRSAELFARRFITPPGDDTVRRTIEYLTGHGRTPSFDLLGEAVLSQQEADDYLEGYLRLLEQLGHDPAAQLRTPGDVAALQVSLKLSSLTHHFTPVDVEGSVARVRPRLEAILEAAERAGVGITVDMEQYELRDLTWEVFTRTLAPGERFGAWPDAGIVLQSYLRDAEAQTAWTVDFARRRGTPFQVRLVKGAYWDYETIVADANRWEPPVLTEKAATDVQFEHLLHSLIEAHPAIHLAVASHNARAHAAAQAIAEAAGLHATAIEHQTLFRTAEGMSRALAEQGWQARDYVPVGELLPGMAYLVRRVLENSSQAGFLLQSRSGASTEELLAPPRITGTPAHIPDTSGATFERSPAARWFDREFRESFEAALRDTRSRWGEHRSLWIGGTEAPGQRVEVHSPSHPSDPPVGTVDFANEETAERAVEVARAARPDWAATSIEERAAILERAAELLETRGHEFAAWVVHEGGRDRSGAWGEVEEAADFLRCYAAAARDLFRKYEGDVAPRGVVAVIPPWNFSLAIPCGMVAAALVCGNTVLLKPAEQTPLIAGRLVDLLHEAGVPRDALIHLPGAGEEVGSHLVESPRVEMVAFTGSRAVGTWMHEAVARVRLDDGGFKAVVTEMGGKNPVIVFADADLDESVAGVIESAFGHANQKCSAASRVFVEAPIFERFRERLAEASRSLIVGPADDPATEVNPVIDREAFDRLQGAADRAREECEVVFDAFSTPTTALQAGPLVVQLPLDRALSTATATEELFGPILVLLPFDDAAEVYAAANGTGYGLTSGVFSRSPETIEEAAAAIEAGHVYVNRSTTAARPGIEPFGGMHLSGTGPKVGQAEYLWAFVQRTDAPQDSPDDLEVLERVGRAHAWPEGVSLAALAPRWDLPLRERAAAVARAAEWLRQTGKGEPAKQLKEAAAAALRELVPHETMAVAGQDTEMRYDVPRGRGVVRVRGGRAPAWLAGTLLGGNAVSLVDSPGLEQVVLALREAGVPGNVLRSEPGVLDTFLGLAGAPEVTFAVTDAGPRAAAALYERLGPTAEHQRSLKAMLSASEGPQPGEPGFLRRFAWAKVVAIRTLRHGADLALGTDD